jgi:hypothetical protein
MFVQEGRNTADVHENFILLSYLLHQKIKFEPLPTLEMAKITKSQIF